MNKLAALLATLTLITAPSLGLANDWTSVCSAGATIDEASANEYLVGNAGLGHRAGATGTVTARYNITNTSGNITPDWNTLELGFIDKSPASKVTAILYAVKPCSGAVKEICRVSSDADAGDIEPCGRCEFLPSEFDFSNELYYVQVNVSRSNTEVQPRATTLRLFHID
ncbi:MAG: hypothetical protein ABR589_05220 [Chthoniobacterales bacterium]